MSRKAAVHCSKVEKIKKQGFTTKNSKDTKKKIQSFGFNKIEEVYLLTSFVLFVTFVVKNGILIDPLA